MWLGVPKFDLGWKVTAFRMESPQQQPRSCPEALRCLQSMHYLFAIWPITAMSRSVLRLVNCLTTQASVARTSCGTRAHGKPNCRIVLPRQQCSPWHYGLQYCRPIPFGASQFKNRTCAGHAFFMGFCVESGGFARC
jgi:hypothetical protein